MKYIPTQKESQDQPQEQEESKQVPIKEQTKPTPMDTPPPSVPLPITLDDRLEMYSNLSYYSSGLIKDFYKILQIDVEIDQYSKVFDFMNTLIARFDDPLNKKEFEMFMKCFPAFFVRYKQQGYTNPLMLHDAKWMYIFFGKRYGYVGLSLGWPIEKEEKPVLDPELYENEPEKIQKKEETDYSDLPALESWDPETQTWNVVVVDEPGTESEMDKVE